MVNTLVSTSLFALALGFAAHLGTGPKTAQEKPAGFYCNMKALTPAEREGMPKLLDRLIDASPSVNELANGYELTFASNAKLFPLAAEWVSRESRCCGFFDFTLAVAHGDGPLVVNITGPDGVKEFIADDLPKLHALMSKR